MNILRRVAPNFTTVLDFGPRAVTVVAAQKRGESFRLLGRGEAPPAGVQNGELSHVGDATEAVSEALEKAERQMGARIKSLYFNLDDAEMLSVRSRGFKALSGDGEIGDREIAAARRVAERLAQDFDRNIIYSKIVRYLMDGRDEVEDPRGIFARHMDLEAQILLVRADHFEAWQNVFRRAGVDKALPVPTGLSAALGILKAEEYSRAWIIADAGHDFLNVAHFSRGRIIDYAVRWWEKEGDGRVRKLIEIASNFSEKNPGSGALFVTGDLAEEEAWVSELAPKCPIPAKRRAAGGLTGFEGPCYASLIGLLRAPAEYGGKAPILDAERGVIGRMREKAAAWVGEYF